MNHRVQRRRGRECVLKGRRRNEGLVEEGGKSLVRVDRQEIGKETSNMGASHGRARKSGDSSGTRVPGGKNVETGSENVNTRSVVGEVGTVIAER